MTDKDVDKLVKLHDKIGFHIAGEGGEFESLVVDGPMFTKSIDKLFRNTFSGSGPGIFGDAF